MIGQQIGNYRLVKLLGSGGFADVYLGQHVLLQDLQAAIKVLHAQLAQRYQAEFLQEANTLARLKHPHIVRILDFGIVGASPYLIMDYAPHGNLRLRHPKGSIVPLGTMVAYVKQIASALQYAHDHNLIHRDLKPENLLVGDDGEILLSDFGIAVISYGTSLVEIGTYAGTVPYSAPEQILGKPRRASDQYSLGIIVYESLTGNRPFQGMLQEVIFQHLGATPSPLHERVPTIPPEVEAVIMKVLAKDPKQRFGSIQAFATALEQASRDAPPTSPSATPPPASSAPGVAPTSQHSLQRHFSRRWVLIGLGGAVMAGAIGSGLWLAEAKGILGGISPTPSATIPILTPMPGTTLFTYRGHADEVWSVTWAPSGRRIASGSKDTTVQVWDATTGDHPFRYPGHSNLVHAVAWAPSGRYIASGSEDRTVQVWDATTGAKLVTYRHSSGVLAVAWSPDSQHMVSASWDHSVQVWNVALGQLLYTYHGHVYPLRAVAWSHDGKYIASGGNDHTVQVWYAATGRLLYAYQGHSDAIHAVAWSPDDRRIASAGGDNTVQVWNASNGNYLLTYKGHAGPVFSVAWSPNGQSIASASADQTVQVWNVALGQLLYTYHGHHPHWVATVAWSHHPQYIASGGGDRLVKVWTPV